MKRVINIGWTLLVVILILIGLQTWWIFFKPLNTQDMLDSLKIVHLIIEGMIMLGFLFLVGWIGQLIYRMWLKERELHHIKEQEQLTNLNRRTFESDNIDHSPDIRSQLESYGQLIGLVKKLVADDLIKKDTGKDLSGLLEKRMKTELEDSFKSKKEKNDEEEDDDLRLNNH